MNVIRFSSSWKIIDTFNSICILLLGPIKWVAGPAKDLMTQAQKNQTGHHNCFDGILNRIKKLSLYNTATGEASISDICCILCPQEMYKQID